jgi:tRNA-specific 2-thiouridylase
MMHHMREAQKTVFVGLSGGVDSSVAALRLQKQGHNVVGVFIKVWHPDFMVCNWEQERLDAMRVAAHLDIPFLTCDAEAEYRDEVAHFFINEYKEGRTPNPDVMCNQHVKFGAFLRFAKEKGADFIATGHYAQRIEEDGSDSQMYRGLDSNKDQTYFLWTLTKEQLDYTLFPVGDTPKEDIRKEAEAAGIPTALKKDSQGICFLGHVDIPEFLSHYIDLMPGDVLNEAGDIIGTHKGVFVYTLGQRHGFTLNTVDGDRTPMFVTSKDIENNTITVGLQEQIKQTTGKITLHSTCLREELADGETIEAQIRYRQEPFTVTIKSISGTSMEIVPTDRIPNPAAGQSCVLYKGEKCIGGGIIA